MSTTSQREYISCAATAKIVRTALKREFPAVAFSVRSKTYSGGASIRVRWIDGPTVKMVERITSQYTGASFDGMIDLKSYHDQEYEGQRVHFGADYIFCEREYSKAFYTQVAAYTASRYGQPLPEIKENEFGAWIEYGPVVEGTNNYTMSNLVSRDASERILTPGGALVTVKVRYA